MSTFTCIILLLAVHYASAEKVGPIRPQLRCPRDFDEIGQTCIKLEFADFLYDCPRGSKRDRKTDECYTYEYVSQEVNCPEGFQASDRHCEKLLRTPLRLECDDRYSIIQDPELRSAVCARKIVHDANGMCPKDYKLTERYTCVKTDKVLPTEAECPPGFRLVRPAPGEKDKPQSYYCESMETEYPAVSCPRGYEFVPQARRLGEKMEAGPLLPADGHCEKVETAAQKVGCPRGFKLEESDQGLVECIRRADLGSPDFQCPEGTSMNKNRRCEMNERKPAAITCRKDYELVEGRCIKILEASPEVSCEKGWKLVPGSDAANPFCEKRIETALPPNPICPPGTILRSNGSKASCVNEDVEVPASYCPVGYEPFAPPITPMPTAIIRAIRRLDGSGFRGTESVENNLQVVGVTANGSGSRKRSAKYRDDAICIKRHILSPEITCNKKFVLHPNSQLCVSAIKTPPVVVCPQGSTAGARGGHCEVTTVLPPKVTCKKGTLTEEGCVEMLEKQPKKICPRRFSPDVTNTECIQVEKVRAERLCPRGVPKGDHCEIRVNVEPTTICPKGFVIGSLGKCQKAHAVEPKAVCDKNYVLEGGFCMQAHD